jgi:hypothetical protein
MMTGGGNNATKKSLFRIHSGGTKMPPSQSFSTEAAEKGNTSRLMRSAKP